MTAQRQAAGERPAATAEDMSNGRLLNPIVPQARTVCQASSHLADLAAQALELARRAGFCAEICGAAGDQAGRRRWQERQGRHLQIWREVRS